MEEGESEEGKWNIRGGLDDQACIIEQMFKTPGKSRGYTEI